MAVSPTPLAPGPGTVLRHARPLQTGQALLECLMRNKNIVMTRQQIEQNAWDFDFEGGSNVIDVYIRYLRKKIDAQYEQKLIHTVRGVGYVMRENE